MGVYLADQMLVFLKSLLLGAALGVFYDAFRISRVAFRTPSAVVFAEDVLFFAVCALATFFFGLTVIDGMLRAFLIAGELLGGIIYFCTLGRLVMRVAKKIIAAVKAVLFFIFRWILRPVWLLIYHIVVFIMRPVVFLRGILKKKFQNAKFRLKVGRKVLYNQLKGYSIRKRTVKKTGSTKNEVTRESIT